MNSNLAPEIFRKRLIIEATFSVIIENQEFVSEFLKKLSKELEMTIIAGPFISSATGKSIPLHDGYEGSLVWAESGVNTYIWTNSKFCTVDIYSCKDFNSEKAIQFVKSELEISEFSYYEIPDPLLTESSSLIELYNTPEKGQGVFAKKFITKGTIICYVDGQIHFAEKESEVSALAVNHVIPFHKLFYRNGFNSNAVKLNHSCNPNCYVKDLFFVTTIRDIQAGEELTYSYSLFCNSDWQNPEGKCLCGSDNCHGKILPWRALPKEEKLKYLPYTADWILFEEMKKAGFLKNLEDDIL